ncbi:hypothetical protein BDZ97DRAFT_1831899 [Flammula alnicola]|nr:hypothetical protein BDZ97DRAFT_1831899 [Flammula alnicola]
MWNRKALDKDSGMPRHMTMMFRHYTVVPVQREPSKITVPSDTLPGPGKVAIDRTPPPTY